MLRLLICKVWLETRPRFACGVCLILAVVSHTVVMASTAISLMEGQIHALVPFARYLGGDLYGGSLLAAWVGLAVLLSQGGLRQEFSKSTSAFSLSLPARRRTWLLAQAIVTVGQLVVLGVLPALMVPMLAKLIGHPFSLTQSMEYALLLVCPGLVFAAWTVFISQIVGGELPGIAVALCSIGAFFVAVKRIPALDSWDLFDTMSGVDLIDRQTFLLHGPLPWGTFAITMAILLFFLGLSVVVLERQDF